MRSASLFGAVLVGCGGSPTVGSSAGPTPQETVDEVLQLGAEATDVLVVVDPEGAAAGLAGEVAIALPMLFDALVGSEASWHVGMLGTGLGDPATLGVISWIDEDAPSPTDILGGVLLDPGVGPFGALGAVQAALDGGSPGFLQDGAPLHVVVVAGADDATPGLAPADLIGWLQALGRDVHWSVYAPAGSTAYAEVAAAFPGTVFDPALTSLAYVLAEEGRSAAGLAMTFPLSTEPVAGTISVDVLAPAGVEFVFLEGVDWDYDAQSMSVTFREFVPTLHSTVRIRYSAL